MTSNDPIIAVPRERIERLEQRVAVLEALVQRVCKTHDGLPDVIKKALQEALPI